MEEGETIKKILGLIASQRKLANGEILVKEAVSAAGEDCQLELLRLADLNLGLCRGCYSCITGKQCPIDDGLYYLVDKIKAADAIILAAPCYALGPAAVTKLLGDRILALGQFLDEFWGKPCLVIATAGIAGSEGYTLSALNTMVRIMGFDLKDSHMFIGALPGEGVLREGAVDRVREMGRALFGQTRPAKEGECPACRSEIWKFTDPKTVVCSACGQKISLVVTDSGVQWVDGEAGKRFYKAHMEDHRRWLAGKVQEFISRRAELAEIRNRYKENNVWLDPEQS